MRELSLTLRLPPKELSPNSRFHWAAKRQVINSYRSLAGAMALQQWVGRRPMDQATIQYRFFWPDRRRRDDDNAIGSMKCARDGIADAGVVRDDRDFTTLPAIFDVDRANPRVEILIQETLHTEPPHDHA
mgnify:CR=1 FL=1